MSVIKIKGRKFPAESAFLRIFYGIAKPFLETLKAEDSPGEAYASFQRIYGDDKFPDCSEIIKGHDIRLRPHDETIRVMGAVIRSSTRQEILIAWELLRLLQDEFAVFRAEVKSVKPKTERLTREFQSKTARTLEWIRAYLRKDTAIVFLSLYVGYFDMELVVGMQGPNFAFCEIMRELHKNCGGKKRYSADREKRSPAEKAYERCFDAIGKTLLQPDEPADWLATELQ